MNYFCKLRKLTANSANNIAAKAAVAFGANVWEERPPLWWSLTSGRGTREAPPARSGDGEPLNHTRGGQVEEDKTKKEEKVK